MAKKVYGDVKHSLEKVFDCKYIYVVYKVFYTFIIQ